ncbi:MAG: hypothetical protein JW874_09580 [Spirochaetales bacterium]|nr:hypothetical protein [Spirochaetales bacterium]
MADCECLPGCPFFNDRMGSKPATADLYKMQYCKSDFETCARYMVFKALGKPAVPGDLYPNQKDRATEILQNAKK